MQRYLGAQKRPLSLVAYLHCWLSLGTVRLQIQNNTKEP